MAISYEYNINVEKINDTYINSKDFSLKFKIDRNKINWLIVKDSGKYIYMHKLIIKIYIRYIHFIYFILPSSRSYKIGSKNNRPKFILGNNYSGNNFSSSNLVEKGKKFNIVLSGWGLRDWDLVLKHKKLIARNLIRSLDSFIFKKGNLEVSDYLLLHIRRTDFLEVDEFKHINFTDKIWLNAILKLCSISSLKKVIIFSDSIISLNLINNLRSNGIEITIPVEKESKTFLDLFISYVSKASLVMCNASTLTLAISFLFHKNIYLPCSKDNFQKINLMEAHHTFPTSINWN